MIEHVIEGHTCIITINNPPANTWTPESLKAMKELMAELNANKNIMRQSSPVRVKNSFRQALT